VCTVFAPYLLSYTSPLPGRTCSPLLFCDFCKRKKKWKMATQGISCGTSMNICIIAQIGSFPLFF
jgi:hypothetical protein